MTNRGNRQGEIATTDDNERAVRTMLRGQKSQIQKALGGAMGTEKFLRIALTAFGKGDDRLAQAHPVSVLSAVISAAQLGLSVDPLAGEAYLVSRWNKHRRCQWAQLMIGYQGLLKRARMSGEVAYFDAGVVHEGDSFEVQLGTEPTIIHERNLGLDITEEPQVIAAYAIATFKGEEQYRRIYVCPRWEIEKARGRSDSSDRGPWKSDYAAMAQKTALRRLIKVCPMDPMTQAAVAQEEAEEGGEIIDIDMEPVGQPEAVEGAPTDLEQLKARVSETAGASQ